MEIFRIYSIQSINIFRRSERYGSKCAFRINQKHFSKSVDGWYRKRILGRPFFWFSTRIKIFSVLKICMTCKLCRQFISKVIAFLFQVSDKYISLFTNPQTAPKGTFMKMKSFVNETFKIYDHLSEAAKNDLFRSTISRLHETCVRQCRCEKSIQPGR